MYYRRGKPECEQCNVFANGDKVVHMYKPASDDGCYDVTTLCNYGGYHVHMDDDVTKVTCVQCINKLFPES